MELTDPPVTSDVRAFKIATSITQVLRDAQSKISALHAEQPAQAARDVPDGRGGTRQIAAQPAVTVAQIDSFLAEKAAVIAHLKEILNAPAPQ